MGVWIEIRRHEVNESIFYVTPFVGVWIEITKDLVNACGSSVTPFVGVWIEIDLELLSIGMVNGHSLRGSVD